MNWKKNRLKYLSATWPVLEDFLGLLKVSLSRHNNTSSFNFKDSARQPSAFGLYPCSFFVDEHFYFFWILTQWDRVTHICVSKLTIIGWDNGQAIIWTNADNWTIGNKIKWNSHTHTHTHNTHTHTSRCGAIGRNSWYIRDQISMKIQLKFKNVQSRKCTWKCRLEQFCSGLNMPIKQGS